jgi:hypothetical protein
MPILINEDSNELRAGTCGGGCVLKMLKTRRKSKRATQAQPFT